MTTKVCLSTLHLVTSRQVFDVIARHMALKRPAKTAASYRYRLVIPGSSDVLCDPIGAIMDDTEYRANFEGHPWYELVEKGTVPREHWRLLDDLQIIHDTVPENQWMEALRKIEGGVSDSLDWTQYKKIFTRD